MKLCFSHINAPSLVQDEIQHLYLHRHAETQTTVCMEKQTEPENKREDIKNKRKREKSQRAAVH